MKNFYIIVCFAIVTSSITAQTKATKKADKLFTSYEYVAAAESYLKLAESADASPYVFKQLGDTYYNMFNSKEAIKWYAKATETNQDAETYFRYAQMLKASKQYEESSKQMQKFVKMQPNDSRAKSFLANPNFVTKISDQEKSYQIKNLDLNSDKSEFGGVLYGNSFYYCSARNTTQKNYGWNKEPFLDIYKSDYNPDGTFMNSQGIAELNSATHDGPVTISADGNTMFFTSDSYREKLFEKDKKNNLKLVRNNLFKTTKENGKWANITPLPFNSNAYSTSNPSLSRDGKTLYFSSDMPGSIGGVDLWKTNINTDGTYTTPENLGTNINTEGNESFPFIADDNQTLYFASSGRQGLGGLDVYETDLSKTEAPKNLGKPVNTEADDFSFSFSKEKNMGFFSSNRTGNDEIYGAVPICTTNLITQVTDAKTGEPLANAKVAVVDSKKVVVATTQTNEQGETSYRVECDKEYSLQVAKEGYISDVYQVTKTNEKTFKTDAKLQPIAPIITEKEVILQPIYFEYNKSNITAEGAYELDKLVTVMNEHPKMIILAKSHTDSRGNDTYNLNLSDRRAKATVQYVISKGIDPTRIDGKGFGEIELKINCGDTCTEEDHAQNRRSEFLIVK
jgi:outer membrane protein OmpA-like peptidoglycan-associated protein/tetratricopeptide (TPR) repeat protein